MKRLDTKKAVTLSALIAVAMILSYVESLIPAFVAVPGVKLGLSNIATVFTLYTLGWQYAICVSVQELEAGRSVELVSVLESIGKHR